MEYLDVFDEWGQPTGTILPRSQCHQEGIWHQSVHLWVINASDEILLQRRALDRESNPGKWDISAAGHISAGQTPLEAVAREAFEEVGLTLSQNNIVYCGRIKHSYDLENFKNREFQEIYLTHLPTQNPSIKIQKSEVMDYQWIPLNNFWTYIEKDFPFEGGLVSHPAEYAMMKQFIQF